MMNLIFVLIFVLAGPIFVEPENIYGQQKELTLTKPEPPKVVLKLKPTKSNVKNKRKKQTVRRKINLSIVPRVIRPTN